MSPPRFNFRSETCVCGATINANDPADVEKHLKCKGENGGAGGDEEGER